MNKDIVLGARVSAFVVATAAAISSVSLQASETVKRFEMNASIESDATGGMRLRTPDTTNGYWNVETSHDLVNWQVVKTLRASDNLASYQHPGAKETPSLYYRLAKANTVERTLTLSSRIEHFGSVIPTYFDGRNRTTFTPASSGGGSWAGGGAIPELVIRMESSRTETTPFFGNDTKRDLRATVGRVLFYDKRLSADNSVSCASCHKQENAFADSGAFSDGIHGQKTHRNSLALANLAFAGKGKFFWDMRESTLKETVLRPIENPVEMGNQIDCLPEKLAEEEYYRTLFKRAYGTPTITEDRIATSLTEFLSAITSHRSKFDRSQSVGLSHLSETERLGHKLFNGRAGCVQCHSFPFFDSTKPTNNGLEIDYKDKGVALLTEKVSDQGLFKTPSLRNIEVTGPYMHDGRFKTLEEVVEFYNEKIQPHDQLDETFRLTTSKWESTPVSEREPIRLELNKEEQAALVAFMRSLTDYPLLHDERFSDPFKK